jgi:signal transduction histidine kinase
VSATDSWPADRSRRGRRLLLAWAVASVINVVLMYLFPGKETIPFHLVWIGLSIVYGFTAWHPAGMAAVLIGVAATTGSILVHHADAGEIGWEETTEVPLMTLVFGVMVWHVHLRQRAVARLAQLAEHERRQADAQQLFVRLVSHELRTPITVARGYTELIRDGTSGPRVAEDAAIVLDELDKLSRITHRLVTLMLMTAAAARQPADIDAELERALHRWAPTADRIWTVRSDVGVAGVVPERLEAALDCLLENAVKFTADGDRIEIVGTRRADGWTIEVLDSGTGMTPERAAALTAATGPLPSSTGTGLGLAIARAVVESWGGRVELRGEPVVGSCVTLWFPPESPEARSAEPYVLPGSTTVQTFNR